MLLKNGNAKLGRGVWTFGLPAGSTCPGKSKSCSKVCYAAKGFYRMPTVNKGLRSSLRASKRPNFTRTMHKELREISPLLVRWHHSGDFNTAEYARKFLELLRANPRTTFLVYTRSWNVGPEHQEMVDVLKLCALEKNCRMWLSADNETGSPPRWKGIAGIAFMALSTADTPQFPVDLVFFVKTPAKPTRFFGGTLVCPNEQGAKNSKEFTCSTCRYCFTKQKRNRWAHKDITQKNQNRRLSLAVV